MRSSQSSSIARQLFVGFTLASALLLSCALCVLYIIVVRHALEEDNAVLIDKVEAVRAALATTGGTAGLQNRAHERDAGEPAAYWIRVLHADGSLLFETPGMQELLPQSVFPPPAPADAGVPDGETYRTDGRLFSLVSIPARDPAGRDLYVQTAQDRSHDIRFLWQLGLLLVTVLLCAIVASGLIARVVARRGLRPLVEMTENLQQVRPPHLDQRVAPSAWPRELQPLAGAFDAMLDRLKESFTRLSQFSADLAHELRTPISNIRGTADVALTRDRTAAEYREVVESIVAECERLSATIDTLLFLARAEAAERRITRTRLDGRAVVEKLVSYFQPLIDDRGIAVTVEGGGMIDADETLLSRAVSNLLDNALRHTPTGGSVKITLRTDAGGAELAVADTGAGIAAGDLPRVFDRFYRADSSRSSAGAGLGLAMVKTIAELHGGTVTVTNQPDGGARFVLRIPAER